MDKQGPPREYFVAGLLANEQSHINGIENLWNSGAAASARFRWHPEAELVSVGKDSGYFANPKRLVDRSATTDTLREVRDAVVVDAERASIPPLLSLLVRGDIALPRSAIPCCSIGFGLSRSIWPSGSAVPEEVDSHMTTVRSE